jgi:hypothetical protein
VFLDHVVDLGEIRPLHRTVEPRVNLDPLKDKGSPAEAGLPFLAVSS